MGLPSRYGVDKNMNSWEGLSAYENGGKGSGNFGHSGRPGEVGGSGDGKGGGTKSLSLKGKSLYEKVHMIEAGDEVHITPKDNLPNFDRKIKVDYVQDGTIHYGSSETSDGYTYPAWAIKDITKIIRKKSSYSGEKMMGMPSRYGIDKKINSMAGLSAYENGGKGSGNFGHAGRPGQVGGSGKGGEVNGESNTSIGDASLTSCERVSSYSGWEISYDNISDPTGERYDSVEGNTDKATVFESHIPTREDFAKAARTQEEITKLAYEKRDDSEWIEGSESVGFLKEKIRQSAITILSEMAYNYHGLEDDGRGQSRVDDVVKGMKDDIKKLESKMDGLKSNRKSIAKRTIKMAEDAISLSGKTGADTKYYMLTGDGNVRSFKREGKTLTLLAENLKPTQGKFLDWEFDAWGPERRK